MTIAIIKGADTNGACPFMSDFTETASSVSLCSFFAISTITQAASAGLKQSFGAAVNNIVYIMLVISVNLGIVNLLPLPALDGGRLVFLIIEAIFRRPVPAKYERWVHAGGFALLICLMLAVTFQDIMRIATGG